MKTLIFLGLLALARTIEAQVTVCRATYGSKITDGAVTGRDFLIELESDTSSSSDSYLLSTGATETNSQNATVFTDRGGRLYAGNKHYSASRDVSFIIFEPSDLSQAIDTIFGVSGEYLYWDNKAFEGGTARFCVDGEERLEAVFRGPLPDGCREVRLHVITAPPNYGIDQGPSSSLEIGAANSSTAEITSSEVPSFISSSETMLSLSIKDTGRHPTITPTITSSYSNASSTTSRPPLSLTTLTLAIPPGDREFTTTLPATGTMPAEVIVGHADGRDFSGTSTTYLTSGQPFTIVVGPDQTVVGVVGSASPTAAPLSTLTVHVPEGDAEFTTTLPASGTMPAEVIVGRADGRDFTGTSTTTVSDGQPFTVVVGPGQTVVGVVASPTTTSGASLLATLTVEIPPEDTEFTTTLPASGTYPAEVIVGTANGPEFHGTSTQYLSSGQPAGQPFTIVVGEGQTVVGVVESAMTSSVSSLATLTVDIPPEDQVFTTTLPATGTYPAEVIVGRGDGDDFHGTSTTYLSSGQPSQPFTIVVGEGQTLVGAVGSATSSIATLTVDIPPEDEAFTTTLPAIGTYPAEVIVGRGDGSDFYGTSTTYLSSGQPSQPFTIVVGPGQTLVGIAGSPTSTSGTSPSSSFASTSSSTSSYTSAIVSFNTSSSASFSNSSTSTSTDLLSRASSIISSDRDYAFCSTLLNYSPFQRTATVYGNSTSTTVLTTRPQNDIVTDYTTTKTYNGTATVDFYTTTITITPTTTETNVNTEVDTVSTIVTTVTFEPTLPRPDRRIRKERRAPVSATTPGLLQTFDPTVLSAACSENVQPPVSSSNATNATTILVAYVTETTTLPFLTQNILDVVDETSTISGTTTVTGIYTPPVTVSTSSATTTTTTERETYTTTDLVAEASSIIVRDSDQNFCTQYLGLRASQATVPYSTTTTTETGVTTLNGVSTEIENPTSTGYVTEPTDTITNTETPHVSADSTIIETETSTSTITETVTSTNYPPRKRDVNIPPQTSSVSIPAALSTYAPNIISSACSLNAVQPSPLPDATQTVLTTQVDTSYFTEPASYYTTTTIVAETDTISSGDYNTTVTVTPPVTDFNYVTTTTTVTETTTSTYTSVVFAGQPTLVLAHPTAIVGDSNGAPNNVDDQGFGVTLPFDMQIYDQSNSQIYVTTNGILSFTNNYAYTNYALYSGQIPAYSAAPFWDDTYIYAGHPQGIYYEIDGTIVTFEYYLSHYEGSDQYYHYLVIYDSANPGVFTYKYYQISDTGSSATVGIQGSSPTALQYSFNQAIVTPNLLLTFNTITNTMTQGTFS